MSYTIGQVASAAGVTARAVRLYESQGLLPSADRSPSSYRVFTDAHVEILRFIRQARSLGLSLEAIAEIVDLADRGATPCARTSALLEQRLREIDQAIADLEQLRNTITGARRAAARAPGLRCAVIESVGDQGSRSN
jgi:MerR family transcriptional regulator, copper efflux regulator